tara:strand:+ start:49607 stop:49846 length:240 start_codon:yes stop_codon:yes gene_type:complete
MSDKDFDRVLQVARAPLPERLMLAKRLYPKAKETSPLIQDVLSLLQGHTSSSNAAVAWAHLAQRVIRSELVAPARRLAG